MGTEIDLLSASRGFESAVGTEIDLLSEPGFGVGCGYQDKPQRAGISSRLLTGCAEAVETLNRAVTETARREGPIKVSVS